MPSKLKCDGCRTGVPVVLLTTRLDEWDGAWKPVSIFQYRICETCYRVIQAARERATQRSSARQRLETSYCDFCSGRLRSHSALIEIAGLRNRVVAASEKVATAGWSFRTCLACLTFTRDRFYTQAMRTMSTRSGLQYPVNTPSTVFSIGLEDPDVATLDAVFPVHVPLDAEAVDSLRDWAPEALFLGCYDPAWTVEAIFRELPASWREYIIPVVAFDQTGNLAELVRAGWSDGSMNRFVTSPMAPITGQVASFAAMNRSPIGRMFCGIGSCIEVRVDGASHVRPLDSLWLVRSLARAVDCVRLDTEGTIVVHTHGSHARAEGMRRRLGFALANFGCRLQTVSSDAYSPGVAAPWAMERPNAA